MTNGSEPAFVEWIAACVAAIKTTVGSIKDAFWPSSEDRP